MGSTHDSSVYRRTDLWHHLERYFHDGTAYILEDSAYSLSNWLIKPFQRPELTEQQDLTEQRAIFNRMLSSARVNVEHAFGRIKMRFPLARQMAVVLDETGASHDRAVRFITVLCCLHNFLLNQGDEWEPEKDEQRYLVQQMDAAYRNYQTSTWRQLTNNREVNNRALRHQNDLGKYKRIYLMEHILQWPGQCTRTPGVW